MRLIKNKKKQVVLASDSLKLISITVTLQLRLRIMF